MPSTAIKAQGSTLKIDTATPGTPDTIIANLRSYSGLDGEAGDIDITNLSSIAKEYEVGLQDAGGFSFEWHPDYSDLGQNTVRSAQNSGTLKTFLLTLSNGVEVEFTGYVKNAKGLSGGTDSVIEGSVSIKITGNPEVTQP